MQKGALYLRRTGIVFVAIVLTIIVGSISLWHWPGIVAKSISQPLEYTPVPISRLEMKCFSRDVPVNWSYCINRMPNSKSDDLIYYFHGRRGNAKWWNDDTYYTGDLYRQWAETKSEPPTVISISFGSLWLLEKGLLLEYFQNELVPQIESKLSLKIDKRLVVGESMGGVNAILAWLNTSSLFDGAASLCAPLPTVSPKASFNEIAEYMHSSNTSWERGLMMLFMGRYLYPDEGSWNQNSPLKVAHSKDLSSAGPLYLSCGKKDDWGCMVGSKQLIENAESNGAQILWYPMEGGHCDIDRMSLARFLGDSNRVYN
ncbi:alpha/beta hydrolase-fold protein [Litoribacillus peritrichatus]|uniref:Esterase n=1 Tax=Litoribacillus peritrichatus TaxID=718191 RepID=A0ABP7MC05_9GAMM